MLNKIKQRKQEGFTIIEVMIVLAIAGLIMLVVFLAVPALQRSGRNNSRKTDANNVLSSVNTYVSNNQGNLPTQATLATAAGEAKLGYYKSDYSTVFYSATAPTNVNTTKGAAGTAAIPSTESMTFVSGGVCNGNSATTTGGSARSYAIEFAIESGNTVIPQCIGS